MIRALKYFGFVLFAVCFLSFCFLLLLEIKAAKRKIRRVSDTLGIVKLKEILSQHRDFIPDAYDRIPFADDTGVVMGVKKLKVHGMGYPYNSCLLEKWDGSGFYLFFRFDVKKSVLEFRPHRELETYIGVAELDRNLVHCDYSFRVIDTKCDSAEDPRAFYCGDDLYLSFNSLVEGHNEARSIKIGKVNVHDWTLSETTDMDMRIQKIEKNWVPFVHENMVHFIYNISPHKVFFRDSFLPHRLQAYDPCENFQLFDELWEKKWGRISGGTPARLVNDEYISFFHSRFKQGPIHCYAIGAYTFEKEPPFTITSITPHPILFRNMYDSKVEHTSNPLVKCLFPAGFAFPNNSDTTVLYLSIGENDVATKVLTINTSELLSSMLRFETREDAILKN